MRRILKESPGREFLLSVLTMVVVGTAWTIGLLMPLERPVSDALIRTPSPRSQNEGPFIAILIDDQAVERFGALPWPREQLADLIGAIRDLGATGVVIDILLSETGFEPADFRLAQALAAGPTVLAATLDTSGIWILPISEFGGLQMAAHANAEIEGDGVIRSFSYTKQADEISLEALSIAAAKLAGWEGTSRPGMVFRPDFLQRPTEIPSISAADILDQTAGAEVIDDHVVFLGVSATGSTDQFVTPVSRWHQPTPGVLVHAAAASSILRGGLIHPLKPWQAWAMAFFTALAIQALRSWAGRLRGRHLALVAVAVIAISLILLWSIRLLIPLVGLFLAAVVSAFLRESAESRDVKLETGKILHSLVKEGRTDQQPPRGPHERLRLARLLQQRIINDRNLRRTLINGLGEGVILWDNEGRPLISNQSFAMLWGDIPTLPEMLHTTGSAEFESSEDISSQTNVEHRHRSLAVSFQKLDDGHLAVVRDRSAERELDKQRREMQRLVSHELKTPLASLAGFGSMLERYTLTDEELRHTAGMIRSEAERLSEMVKIFLDLERLGAGHQEHEWLPVDLADLVCERCQVLSAFSQDANIEVEVRVDRPALILGVPVLLAQVVDNLIGNAIKFASEGTTVVVEVVAHSDEIVLTVADFGPGIPADAIPHLFERFYRVPGSGKQGTGLGLALVQEVAEHHRAIVTVESVVGEGSKFTVTFPSHGTSKEAS